MLDLVRVPAFRPKEISGIGLLGEVRLLRRIAETIASDPSFLDLHVRRHFEERALSVDRKFFVFGFGETEKMAQSFPMVVLPSLETTFLIGYWCSGAGATASPSLVDFGTLNCSVFISLPIQCPAVRCLPPSIIQPVHPTGEICPARGSVEGIDHPLRRKAIRALPPGRRPDFALPWRTRT